VFNPTETKKNGPARTPANTPARCSVARFTASSAVLPATAPSYGDARDSVNARSWQWFTARSVDDVMLPLLQAAAAGNAL
jgi:hypothetical protein